MNVRRTWENNACDYTFSDHRFKTKQTNKIASLKTFVLTLPVLSWAMTVFLFVFTSELNYFYEFMVFYSEWYCSVTSGKVSVVKQINYVKVSWEIYSVKGSDSHYVKCCGMSMIMDKFQVFEI